MFSSLATEPTASSLFWRTERLLIIDSSSALNLRPIKREAILIWLADIWFSPQMINEISEAALPVSDAS